MTPMTLDAALKVVLDRLKYPLTQEDAQIAAVLRAFLEKGLPFYEAADRYFGCDEDDGAYYNLAMDAYRAKEC